MFRHSEYARHETDMVDLLIGAQLRRKEHDPEGELADMNGDQPDGLPAARRLAPGGFGLAPAAALGALPAPLGGAPPGGAPRRAAFRAPAGFAACLAAARPHSRTGGRTSWSRGRRGDESVVPEALDRPRAQRRAARRRAAEVARGALRAPWRRRRRARARGRVGAWRAARSRSSPSAPSTSASTGDRRARDG